MPGYQMRAQRIGYIIASTYAGISFVFWKQASGCYLNCAVIAEEKEISKGNSTKASGPHT